MLRWTVVCSLGDALCNHNDIHFVAAGSYANYYVTKHFTDIYTMSVITLLVIYLESSYYMLYTFSGLSIYTCSTTKQDMTLD